MIKAFAEIHDNLNETVVLINHCYSVQMMIYFLFIFALIIMFVFSTLTYKSYFIIETMWLVFIGGCIWNFYQAFFILTIMYAGSVATREGQKTSSIVHKALNQSINEEVNVKVRPSFLNSLII